VVVDGVVVDGVVVDGVVVDGVVVDGIFSNLAIDNLLIARNITIIIVIIKHKNISILDIFDIVSNFMVM
jgi:hypothetical protein